MVIHGISAQASSLPLQGKLILTECCHSAPWSAEVYFSIPERDSGILGVAANQTVASLLWKAMIDASILVMDRVSRHPTRGGDYRAVPSLK